MWRINSRVREHLSNPNSNHYRIAAGFVWVSLFVLIGKLAGAAKEMAIAWRYGVSPIVDAYVFVLNLAIWPVSVWFSVLTMALVPLVARLRNESPNELPRFMSELLAFTLFLGIGLGVVFWIGLPLSLIKGWVGLSDPTLVQALNIVGPLSFVVPLSVIICLLSTWTMAIGRHRNTLVEAVPALVILFALLSPPSWLSEPLIWGTVMGIALQLVALGWPLQRSGELHAPVLSYQSSAWRIFWRSIGILTMGQLLSSLSSIIDQFLAASLPVGALSVLSYSDRILALINGMGAVAIARATLPVFSHERAIGGTNVNELALKWALWMFIGGIIVAVVGFLVSPFLVKLLFERGAFTASNTREVATLLAWSMIQVPFYFGGLVLTAALGSGGYFAIIALSGASNLLFKIAFAFPLVRHFELIGVPISTSAMYAASLVVLYISVRAVARKDNDKGAGRN